MTHSAPGCVLEDVLENRSPSPSLLGWAKTFLPRSGRRNNMLSPAHCDALWCRDSFRSRCREEISGPIIWVLLPAVLRGFWAGHGSLPPDRADSPNSEHFCSEATKNVRPSALVWTNLSCSRMRRPRAYHRRAPRICGQYAASYRPRTPLGRGRPACPPLGARSLSVEAREWWSSPWCGEPAFHSPCGFERSGDDFGCECSTPRRFESGRGVETRTFLSRRDCAAGDGEWKAEIS